MGKKVVIPKVVFKQVGTQEEIERAMRTAYNRIFTIAVQNIRARREKERQDKGKVEKNNNGLDLNP